MLGILAGNQLMWGNFIEQNGQVGLLIVSSRLGSCICLLLLGMGNCWYGLAVPFAVMFKIVLIISRQQDLLQSFYREGYVYGRAWEIAIKDGNLSKFEMKIIQTAIPTRSHDLTNSRIAARMTIERVQKKRFLKLKRLILGGVRLIESKEYCEEPGKTIDRSMTTDVHFVLSGLYNRLIKEEELEASTNLCEIFSSSV